MSEWIQQWLNQNAPWLNPLGSLVTILTGILAAVAFVIFKPLCEAIPKIWALLSRSFKTAAKQPCVTLRFVAMNFPHSHWGMGRQAE